MDFSPTKEITCINDVYMYYHDTSEYTLAINLYPSGRIEIGRNDKLNQSMNQKIDDIDNLSKQYNELKETQDVKTWFDSLELLIERDENILDDSLIKKTYSDEVNLISSDTEIAKKIDAELSSIFGSPYSNKYLGKLTSQGYTAYLYETMCFERYKHNSWFLNAGSTLAAVASWMAIPQATALRIITFVGSVAAGYSVYKDLTANQYYANIHNNKTVKVGADYPYRAGKSQYGYCYIGDKGAEYVSINKVNKDSDFDNNTLLMQKGIDNQINYGY